MENVVLVVVVPVVGERGKGEREGGGGGRSIQKHPKSLINML